MLATVAPFNGGWTGLTSLGVDAVSDGELILGIADQRGDGRPDYVLHSRLLYASQVSPQNLPLRGGIITISGSGFHSGVVVSLESRRNPQILAVVTDVTPNLLVATVPPALSASGSLDLVVTDPATNGIAAIAAGISYGDASTDTLAILASPQAPVAIGVPSAFTVRVVGPDQVTPVGGVPVTFNLLAGSATLSSYPQTSCNVITTGDGFASVNATATALGAITLKASLSNGNALLTQFAATVTPTIASLTPPLFIAPGASWTWSPQVELWSGVFPAAAAPVNWSSSGAWATIPASSTTNVEGIASISFNLGPWPPAPLSPSLPAVPEPRPVLPSPLTPSMMNPSCFPQ